MEAISRPGLKACGQEAKAGLAKRRRLTAQATAPLEPLTPVSRQCLRAGLVGRQAAKADVGSRHRLAWFLHAFVDCGFSLVSPMACACENVRVP